MIDPRISPFQFWAEIARYPTPFESIDDPSYVCQLISMYELSWNWEAQCEGQGARSQPCLIFSRASQPWPHAWPFCGVWPFRCTGTAILVQPANMNQNVQFEWCSQKLLGRVSSIDHLLADCGKAFGNRIMRNLSKDNPFTEFHVCQLVQRRRKFYLPILSFSSWHLRTAQAQKEPSTKLRTVLWTLKQIAKTLRCSFHKGTRLPPPPQQTCCCMHLMQKALKTLRTSRHHTPTLRENEPVLFYPWNQAGKQSSSEQYGVEVGWGDWQLAETKRHHLTGKMQICSLHEGEARTEHVKWKRAAWTAMDFVSKQPVFNQTSLIPFCFVQPAHSDILIESRLFYRQPLNCNIRNFHCVRTSQDLIAVGHVLVIAPAEALPKCRWYKVMGAICQGSAQ